MTTEGMTAHRTRREAKNIAASLQSAVGVEISVRAIRRAPRMAACAAPIWQDAILILAMMLLQGFAYEAGKRLAARLFGPRSVPHGPLEDVLVKAFERAHKRVHGDAKPRTRIPAGTDAQVVALLPAKTRKRVEARQDGAGGGEKPKARAAPRKRSAQPRKRTRNRVAG